jgi:hypothetical protein
LETATLPDFFNPRPQRPYDPRRFVRLATFLDAHSIDWETYLHSLLTEGLAPPPIVFERNLYIDRTDEGSFRGRLRAASMKRAAELMRETEILAPPVHGVETAHAA